MSGRGREARPTSYFSRNDTHQTAIKRIISHCHAEYAYKKRFLEVSNFLRLTQQLSIRRSSKWILPSRMVGLVGHHPLMVLPLLHLRVLAAHLALVLTVRVKIPPLRLSSVRPIL